MTGIIVTTGIIVMTVIISMTSAIMITTILTLMKTKPGAFIGNSIIMTTWTGTALLQGSGTTIGTGVTVTQIKRITADKKPIRRTVNRPTAR